MKPDNWYIIRISLLILDKHSDKTYDKGAHLYGIDAVASDKTMQTNRNNNKKKHKRNIVKTTIKGEVSNNKQGALSKKI